MASCGDCGRRFCAGLVLLAIAWAAAPDVRADCTPEWVYGPDQGVPGVDGELRTIHAMIRWDPDGTGPENAWLVIGGQIDVAGDVAANNIAAWDGSRWHSLDGGTSAKWLDVRALGVYGRDLIAAGRVETGPYTWTNYIAKWVPGSPGAWVGLGSEPNGSVHALLPYNGELVAAGEFTQIGGVSANRIASWNGSRWAAFDTGISDHEVQALATYQGRLIAGGTFSGAGGATAMYLAAWDGVAWSEVAAPFAISPAGSAGVYALSLHDGNLVVAWFNINDSGNANVTSWDGSAWTTLGAPIDMIVWSIASVGGELYIGGRVLGNHGVARWDGAAWTTVGDGGVYPVYALAEYAGKLVSGGETWDPAAQPYTGLAFWDGLVWTRLGGRGFNGSVNAFTIFNGELVAGGEFGSVAAGEAVGVATWNGVRWAALGAGLRGAVGSLAGVRSLAVYRNDLFAGGEFTFVGGSGTTHIAKWNGSAWSSLGSDTDGPVAALTVYNDELIAGGTFSSAGGVTAHSIARWDGTQWRALAAANGAEGVVDSVQMGLPVGGMVVNALWIRGALIVGGNIVGVAGTPLPSPILVPGTMTSVMPSNPLLSWSASNWASLGMPVDPWPGTTAAPAPQVFALTEYNGDLIVGGIFTCKPNSQSSTLGLAKWNGTTWSRLGTGVDTMTSAGVRALATYNGELYAGGSFTTMDGVTASNIARWDGSKWLALANTDGAEGVSGPVRALTVYRGELVIGGEFLEAAGKVSCYWARWGCGLATGACCVNSATCQVMTQADCTAAGGTYRGDASACASVDCTATEAVGACCLLDGTCPVVTAASCAAQGGTYQGDNTVCDVLPCVPCTDCACGPCGAGVLGAVPLTALGLIGLKRRGVLR